MFHLYAFKPNSFSWRARGFGKKERELMIYYTSKNNIGSLIIKLKIKKELIIKYQQQELFSLLFLNFEGLIFIFEVWIFFYFSFSFSFTITATLSNIFFTFQSNLAEHSMKTHFGCFNIYLSIVLFDTPSCYYLRSDLLPTKMMPD